MDESRISDGAKSIMMATAMCYKVYRSAGIPEMYAFELAKNFQNHLLLAIAVEGEEEIAVDDL